MKNYRSIYCPQYLVLISDTPFRAIHRKGAVAPSSIHPSALPGRESASPPIWYLLVCGRQNGPNCSVCFPASAQVFSGTVRGVDEKNCTEGYDMRPFLENVSPQPLEFPGTMPSGSGSREFEPGRHGERRLRPPPGAIAEVARFRARLGSRPSTAQ